MTRCRRDRRHNPGTRPMRESHAPPRVAFLRPLAASRSQATERAGFEQARIANLLKRLYLH